jgi:hypothetical protein
VIQSIQEPETCRSPNTRLNHSILQMTARKWWWSSWSRGHELELWKIRSSAVEFAWFWPRSVPWRDVFVYRLGSSSPLVIGIAQAFIAWLARRARHRTKISQIPSRILDCFPPVERRLG